MKRTIVILLIAVLFVLPCATYADFEPASDTPYGIPLYSSPEEVDLSVILEGNGKDRILDQIGVFKMTENRRQSGSYSSSSLYDNYYIKENTHSEYLGTYFEYSVPVGSDGLKSTHLTSFDVNNPFFNQFDSDGGRTDQSLNPRDENTIYLKRPAPFNITPEEYDFEITNSAVKDGMYYIEFNLTPKSADSLYKYFDYSVLIDPDTSLIYEYSYKYYYSKRDITLEACGEVDYNVSLDEIPDYSVLF